MLLLIRLVLTSGGLWFYSFTETAFWVFDRSFSILIMSEKRSSTFINKFFILTALETVFNWIPFGCPPPFSYERKALCVEWHTFDNSVFYSFFRCVKDWISQQFFYWSWANNIEPAVENNTSRRGWGNYYIIVKLQVCYKKSMKLQHGFANRILLDYYMMMIHLIIVVIIIINLNLISLKLFLT